MRFTVSSDWKDNQLLQLVLAWFLLFVALLWVTNALLYFSQMGLTPSSVIRHYRGDEAAFMQPRSFKVLLEITHFQLFAMGILVLTMTHLVLFVPLPNQVKAWVVSLAFASTLADESAGWLIRYVAPGFAYLKIAGFVVLQATLGFMIAAVVCTLATAQPNDYRSGASGADDEEF
jgi:hypothetical protein